MAEMLETIFTLERELVPLERELVPLERELVPLERALVPPPYRLLQWQEHCSASGPTLSSHHLHSQNTPACLQERERSFSR